MNPDTYIGFLGAIIGGFLVLVISLLFKSKKQNQTNGESSGEDKNNFSTKVLTILIIVALAVFYFLYRPISKIDTTPIKLVTYSVTGTVEEAFVYYANANGDTEQEDITLPWEKRFNAKVGTFLYISAQVRSNKPGTIITQIKSGNIILKSSTSKGRFVIADASGILR